jgi:REP element-mobilizing transposase RayT
MARKPRVHFPGALYHVISRGNQKQDIFLDDRDLKAFLSYLSEYKTRYPFHLYAYALMRNHFHLLLEVEGTPLSKIMQSLLFRYTRYFNKRYGKVGHLFQGRYKAILCDKDAYLLELIRYIHLNPVRAKVVTDAERYLWTSHLSYLGMLKDGLIEEDFVLGQFGKKKSLARRKYRRFVIEELDSGHQEKYYKVKDQRFLGEDSFIDRIEVEKRGGENAVFDIPIEVIAQEVSRATGIARNEMYSLTRNRKGAHGRSMVAYLGRAISGHMVTEIAQHFQRSPMRISQAIIQFENELREDNHLRKTIEKLEEDLIEKAKKKYFITIA